MNGSAKKKKKKKKKLRMEGGMLGLLSCDGAFSIDKGQELLRVAEPVRWIGSLYNL